MTWKNKSYHSSFYEEKNIFGSIGIQFILNSALGDCKVETSDYSTFGSKIL